MSSPLDAPTAPAGPSPYAILKSLVLVPGAMRGEAIEALVPGVIRQPVRQDGRVIGHNRLVGDPAPRVVIGAHFDIDPGTREGAIDNTAGVAVLVALAERLQAEGLWPAGLQIAFWDLEEPGNGAFAAGSATHARALRRAMVSPDLVVVCDVLGLGDPVLSTRSDRTAAALVHRVLEAGTIPVRARSTPGSDDVGFAMAGIGAALLTTLPASGDTSAWRAMHSLDDTIALVDPASLAMCVRGLDAVIDEYLVRGVRAADVAAELRHSRRPAPRVLPEPVQMGLFETAPAPSPRALLHDPRQLEMFAAPSPAPDVGRSRAIG